MKININIEETQTDNLTKKYLKKILKYLSTTVQKQAGGRGTRCRHKLGVYKNLNKNLLSVSRQTINIAENQFIYVHFALYCD